MAHSFAHRTTRIAVLTALLGCCLGGCSDDGASNDSDTAAADSQTAGGEDASSDFDSACTPASDDAPPLGAVFHIDSRAQGVAACLQTTGVDSISVEAWAAKVVELGIGANGEPGQGLDVDGDPSTCAPENSCSGGIDNGLGGLSGVANSGIGEALAQGRLMLALDTPGLSPAVAGVDDGFELRMYTIYIDPVDQFCDWQQDICDYQVRTDSFDEQCRPLVSLQGRLESDGTIRAGDGASSLALLIPLFGVDVRINARSVRLEGTTEFDCEGRPVGLKGVLAGALLPDELQEALDTIPEEEFDAAGVSKSFVLGALSLLAVDFDSDGDGTADAISVGLVFSTHPGVLVGVTEPAQ